MCRQRRCHGGGLHLKYNGRRGNLIIAVTNEQDEWNTWAKGLHYFIYMADFVRRTPLQGEANSP